MLAGEPVAYNICGSMWAVLFLAAYASAQSGDDSRLVRLTQGPVLGHLNPIENYYSFYNIPYASVPTGTQRFKAPLPPPVWIQTLDAVDRGIICPQPGASNLNMREDCLIVNVFVPNTNETNLSVVVIIHGGAYQYSYGNAKRLNNLVQTNKIITVTFNYRLGAHGFLCLGTEDIPGNAGLKDQVAVLRWVNQNIVSFGGNPDDVTLLACSAGAGAGDVLTLSKTTKGLYNKVILESGVSFGAVGLQIDPLENAKTYARYLNFEDVENITALEEFYKTATFQKLLSRADVITNNENSAALFAPCVERDVGQEIILEDAPINIIKQGNYENVPRLYGFANMEGLMRIWAFESWSVRMNEKFSDFLPAELAFETEEEKDEVAKFVKEYYFGDAFINEEHVLTFIDYFTDVLFAYPILRSLNLRIESLNDTIYLYEYSFVDENTPSIPYTDQRGADHCEQAVAVSDEDMTNVTEEYREIKSVMRELWSNFILTGTPVPESSQLPAWPAANAAGSPHMSLGRTVELKGALLPDRVAFWDTIYKRYYRAPIPPSNDLITGGASTIAVTRILTAFIIIIYYLF